RTVPCRSIVGWSSIAFAEDWQRASRQQNATSFFYFTTNQWKYEEAGMDTLRSPLADEERYQHPADYNILANRLGWMPSYPQFNKNSLSFAEEMKDASDDELVNEVVDQLKSEDTRFAMEDPDAPENFPRSLFVWRSNL